MFGSHDFWKFPRAKQCFSEIGAKSNERGNIRDKVEAEERLKERK
jgi:hypothetical protein